MAIEFIRISHNGYNINYSRRTYLREYNLRHFFFFNLNGSIFLFTTTVPILEFRNIEGRREKYFSDMFQMDHPER